MGGGKSELEVGCVSNKETTRGFFSLSTVAQDLPEVQLLIINVERKGENGGM